MQVKTLLNYVQRYQSFVYQSAHLVPGPSGPTLEVEIQPRANSKPVCSGCGQPGPGYDREPKPRRFQFIPCWGILVFFLYAMRRVDCARCGVKVERVPWAEGQNHLTTAYQWFLATWAKVLSWRQVARSFRTSWDNVFRSVKMAVAWGLADRLLEGIGALGM